MYQLAASAGEGILDTQSPVCRLRQHVLGVALIGLLVLGLGSGCSVSSIDDEPGPPVEMVDEGSWYSVLAWPHDGKPYESSNFVVFSDAASEGARREAADVAERVWTELVDEFDLTLEMLHFPAGQNKVHLYAYKDRYPQDWGGRAYHGGLFMWSLDHEQRPHHAGNYAAVMKHELVHVIQDLLFGGFDPPVDVWFYEGLAEAVVGGTSGGAIRGLDQLNDLTAEYGTISPVSLKWYSQIPSPDAGFHFDYPMFQLAVEYLIDNEGHGRSLVDARDVMIDVGGGASFEEAFEARMGIGLGDYQDEFFGLMNMYLPRYRNPMSTPVGIAVVSAAVALVVVGPLAVSARRWRLGAANIERALPGRLAAIGFYTEITVASFVVIAVFLLGLTAIGAEGELYNISRTPSRMRAYWTLGGYLLASVGLLLWAVHRWIHRSRLAFLIAPLIIVATGIAILVVNAMI